MNRSRLIIGLVIFVLIGLVIMLWGINTRLKREKKACEITLIQTQKNLESAQQKSKELFEKQQALIEEKDKLNEEIRLITQQMDVMEQEWNKTKAAVSQQDDVIKALEKEKLDMVSKMMALKMEKESIEQELAQMKKRSPFGWQFWATKQSVKNHLSDDVLVGNRGFVVKGGKSVYFSSQKVDVVAVSQQ